MENVNKDKNKAEQGQASYNFILLHPVLIYSGLTLLYFLPAYICGRLLTDATGFLLSSEAANPVYLDKGLILVLESVIFFAVGFYIFKASAKLPKPFVFPSGGSIINTCLFAVIIGVLIYGPVRYFGGGYAVYDLDDPLWQVGNGIVYFCAEVLVGLALIVETFTKKRIRYQILLTAVFILLIMLFRLKRLELLISLLSFFSFYVCVKNIKMKTVIIVMIIAIVTISLVGGLRYGLQGASWYSVAGSIVLEANFTVNSLFGTIYLIDDRHFNFTYGLNLLSIPIRVIPSFLLPYKYDIVSFLSDDDWSGSYNLSPLGASYGISHLYRYGGQIAVILFSTFLGGLFKILYSKFKMSLLNNVKSAFLMIYPIILYGFIFHFVRDDVTVAFKMLFQLFVVYYTFVIVKSQIREFRRQASSKRQILNDK